ncbi:MAG TPA: transglycosylase SLT domain-containing protein [Candidatus Polarisedimenticolaceae bacterium]|nr:transglycosylase SLT domain-containing protein [Candidatus Polarisedimenticolaceae bacterium]
MVRDGIVVTLILFATCAISCATSRPQTIPEPPAAEPGAVVEPSVGVDSNVSPPPPPDLTPLYARLDPAHREYREGIELLSAGDEIGGEFKISNAANELRSIALECASSDGCEMDRVLDVVDELLSLQNVAIKQQAFHIEGMEASIAQDVEREPGTSSFDPLPELGRTVSLLKGTDLRDLITLNGPVKAAIDDWLTWMRPMLMESWNNYQYLRDRVAPVYEEAGLPEALLFAMMASETGVKAHSFSRAGAAGPLQFMRGTGQKYGLRVIDGFDTRLDPVESTRANVAYLDDQFDVFNDSLEKVLAAYNGGENRMRTIHRRHDGASLWDSEVFYSLPRETREYVPRILAAAWLFLHPEEYNLELPELLRTTVGLTLRQEISLGELTVCLGQTGNPNGWFRTLRNLNPRFDPGERIAAGLTIEVPTAVVEPYERQCLAGELLAKARELHDANYPDEPEMIVYTVRNGDTLSRIASRHSCVSLGELAALNDIRPPRYVIHVGQRVKIPACG